MGLLDPPVIKPRASAAALSQGKVKGGNIVPKPSVGPGGQWGEWDWTNWVKPQVDRAAALGLNAVRIIGAPQAVLVRYSTDVPAISQATYNARWEQLAAYCLSKGLRLYPCLTEKWAYMYTQFGGLGGTPPWNFQNPTVTAVITSSAATLAKYPNIIGFDIFQEGGGSHGDGLVAADVLALYAAIRAAAPGVPLTTSDSSGSFTSAELFWNNTTSMSYQLWTATGGADFVDVHVYLEGVNAAQIDGLIKRTGKPIIIGEYGGGQDITSSQRVARYTSAKVLHNRGGILGSFLWALADQGTTDDKKYGVMDNTGFSQPTFPSPSGATPLSVTAGHRPEVVNVLSTFALAELPIQTEFSQPNLLSAIQSRPINSTVNWSGDANTVVFGEPRGLAVQPTVVGNILVGARSTERIPVIPSTYYRFSAELLASVAGRTVEVGMDWFDASGGYLGASTPALFTTPGNIQTPLPISAVAQSNASAAYASPRIRVLSTASTSEKYIILANPRPYLGGM